MIGCVGEHGGFPGPFLRRELRFTRRWRMLAREQLSRKDLRELASIRDLGSIEMLMQLLAEHSGQQLIYSNLATELQVRVDTVRRWTDRLARMHYGIVVRPWFANMTKALRKEPKWFLRDWSGWRGGRWRTRGDAVPIRLMNRDLLFTAERLAALAGRTPRLHPAAPSQHR